LHFFEIQFLNHSPLISTDWQCHTGPWDGEDSSSSLKSPPPPKPLARSPNAKVESGLSLPHPGPRFLFPQRLRGPSSATKRRRGRRFFRRPCFCFFFLTCSGPPSLTPLFPPSLSPFQGDGSESLKRPILRPNLLSLVLPDFFSVWFFLPFTFLRFSCLLRVSTQVRNT